LRNILYLAAAIVCAGLVSCSEARAPQSTTSAAMDSAPITRAPLSPAAGYAAAPEQSYADPIPQDSRPAGNWRASRRWSAVQGNGCIAVDRDQSTGKLTYENCPAEQANDQPPQNGDQQDNQPDDYQQGDYQPDDYR
jgi:hypothetical protein